MSSVTLAAAMGISVKKPTFIPLCPIFPPQAPLAFLLSFTGPGLPRPALFPKNDFKNQNSNNY
jgi:hypothetical protein